MHQQNKIINVIMLISVFICLVALLLIFYSSGLFEAILIVSATVLAAGIALGSGLTAAFFIYIDYKATKKIFDKTRKK